MKNINSFLKQQVDNNITPSAQYVFFDSESIIHEFSYGLGDIKANKIVDDTTTYNLFSVTKTFTALAVLQLAQSGKISLNDTISNYLPGLPFTPGISIEQLLNHSSGITNPLPLLSFVNTLIAGLLYALVAVMWLIPDKRIERVLDSE